MPDDWDNPRPQSVLPTQHMSVPMPPVQPPLQAAGQCPYCGQSHKWACTLVKAFEYHENGALKRVEFREYTKVVGPVSVSGEPIPEHTTKQ